MIISDMPCLNKDHGPSICFDKMPLQCLVCPTLLFFPRSVAFFFFIQNNDDDGGDKKDYDDVNHKYRDDAPTDALHSSSFMQMHIKLSPLQTVMVMAVARFDALMLKRLCAKKINHNNHHHHHHHHNKGRVATPKRMNFQKSSKGPLTPLPPSFRKILLQFFGKRPKKALFKGPKSAIKFLGLKMAPPKSSVW